ncbi:MAG TPA: hypothetical protein VMP68_18175 [Candidatus Eisenbacteria bacterium]|jgi:F0F1-type ATP synthase membrane subunit b/b'|nr:hypothetical protein [Candidatus Eisenbacteria bacterium]
MDDSEIRGKEAELAALRKEAAGIVATASSQGRELTKEEDTHVLALLNRVRLLEEEIHRHGKHRSAG